MTIHYTVVGNTSPPIVINLVRSRQQPIDLTAATAVKLIIKKQGGSITNTGNQTASVTDATAGEITYNPSSGVFPSSGTYLADVEITYNNATVEVVYEQLKIIARVRLA